MNDANLWRKNKLFNQALPVFWICLAKMTTFRTKGFISPNLRLQEMKLFIDCPIRRSPHVFQVQLKGSPEGSPAPASWSHAWRRQHTFKWPTGKPTTFPPPQELQLQFERSWRSLLRLILSLWAPPSTSWIEFFIVFVSRCDAIVSGQKIHVRSMMRQTDDNS